MLLITPEYAALREQRARQTIDWLTGNFSLKPLRAPVVARLHLSSGADADHRPRKVSKRKIKKD